MHHLASGRRRRAALTLGVALSLVHAVPALGLTPGREVLPAGGTSSLWGWVTARQPTSASYTPGAKDQGNSTGGTNTVERLDVGKYKVIFGGLGAGSCAGEGCAGGIMVSALSTSQRICTGVELGSNLPVNVFVNCVDRSGTFADSGFSVNFLAPRDFYGTVAYFFADDPDNTTLYYPSGTYNFNSGTTDINSVQRLGVGYYEAVLPQMRAEARGNIQVQGVDAACRVERRIDHVVDDYSTVFVRCRDFARNPADSYFWLLYIDGVGLKGVPGQPAGYVWANKPTASAYQPPSPFSYSSAGQTPSITRSGVGNYKVKLTGMPLGGSAQVTAYGWGGSECQLSSIRTGGLPQRIGVRCFRPNGAPVDSKFYLTFTR